MVGTWTVVANGDNIREGIINIKQTNLKDV